MEKFLFMVLLGCKPEGRNTEQHDVFFGIGSSLADLKPAMQKFWPGVKLHIDAWAQIDYVDYSAIIVLEAEEKQPDIYTENLFFINLGGYKPGEFEEYHKKILFCGQDIAEAINYAKVTPFYVAGQSLETGSRSHIDDKFEVDEVIAVNDLLQDKRYKVYGANVMSVQKELTMNIGYLSFSKF